MAALNSSEVMDVLSSYLITSMFGGSTDKKQHLFDKKHINLRYPHWETSFLFLTDIAGSDTFRRSPSSNPFVENQKFFFQDLIRMAERVSEEFGPWSDHECHDMKDLLMQRDVHGTGRIRLADFYRKSQDGAWQFLESTDYLRQLGALDESSRTLGPQVIIPNYMTGMSNCISSTPFYAACCMNECMGLMSELESRVRVSAAAPGVIAEAVAQMSSSTQMPRNLSTGL